MTKSRNIKDDVELTDKIILNRFNLPLTETSWLGHRGKGAVLDYELLKGRTLNELENISGRQFSAEAHLQHLKNEHGLTITNEDNIYKLNSQSKTGMQNSLSTKKILGVDIRTEPPNEVRVLVYHLLKEKNAKSIEELVTDLGVLVPVWRDSKNLKGRIKRSLENTPSVILEKDKNRGPSEQSRKFSIHLQYSNVRVIELDNKFTLELTNGYIPEIRMSDFRKEDIVNDTISNNHRDSEVKNVVALSSRRNEEKLKTKRTNTIYEESIIYKSLSKKKSNWISRFIDKISQTFSILSKNKVKSLEERAKPEDKDDLKRLEIQKKSEKSNLKENDELESFDNKVNDKKKLLDLKEINGFETDQTIKEGLCLGEQDIYKDFESSFVFNVKLKKVDSERQANRILMIISGFLNADGGSLFLGVNNDGYINGLQNDYKYLGLGNNSLTYKGLIRKHILKDFNSDIYRKLVLLDITNDGLEYLEIIIPKHEKPVSFKDNYYKRHGNETQLLSGKDLEILLKSHKKLEENVDANDEVEEQKADIELKLSQNKLTEIFINDTKSKFSFLSTVGNPFKIYHKGENKYKWIFLKNISSDFEKDGQLSEHRFKKPSTFEKIENSICIPVGYDPKNRVYVVWDPWHFMNKIYDTDVISVYSRPDKRREVSTGMYMPFELNTGEKYYNVNEIFIGKFLSNIEKYFEQEAIVHMEEIDAQKPGSIYNVMSSDEIPVTNQNSDLGKSLRFVLNKEYKKSDIYKIIKVPEKQQGGKWNNGYCLHEGDHFIFTNIDQAGHGYERGNNETHFDYNNGFDKDGNLFWEAINASKIHWDSIQKLKASQPYIFVRKPNTKKNFWQFVGVGKCIKIENTSPVRFIWEIKSNNKENEPDKIKLEQEKSAKLSDTSLENYLKYEGLSRRSYNLCKYNGLNNLTDVLNYFEKYKSFLKLRNCGKRSNEELIQLCEYLLPDSFVANSIIDEGSFNEKSNLKNTIESFDNLQVVAANFFILEEFDKLDTRSMNSLNTLMNGNVNLLNIKNKVLLTDDFKNLRLRNVGKKSQQYVEKFIINVKEKLVEIPNLNVRELKRIRLESILRKKFNVKDINDDLLMYGNIFEILFHFLKNGYIFKGKEKQIFEAAFDIFIDKSPKLLKRIGGEVGLSYERVRQIRVLQEKSLKHTFGFVSEMKEYWNIYGLKQLHQGHIWFDDNLINDINKKAMTKFNRNFMHFIFALSFKKEFSLIGNLSDVFGELKNSTKVHQWKNLYIVSEELKNYFNFTKFVNTLHDNTRTERSTDLSVDFNKYISRFKSIPVNEILDKLFQVCERIAIEEFALTVSNNKIKFSRKTYKKVYEYAYEALEDLGTPSKVSSIYNKVVQLHPNYQTSENSIRASLKSVNGFVPVGRSSVFGLKKWENEMDFFKGGTIRSITAEFLEKFDSPKHISEITNYVKKYRPNTNEKSVYTNLKIDESNTFMIFGNALFGLKNKTYNSKYVLLKQDSSKIYDENIDDNSAQLDYKRKPKLNSFSGIRFNQKIDDESKNKIIELVHQNEILAASQLFLNISVQNGSKNLSKIQANFENLCDQILK